MNGRRTLLRAAALAPFAGLSARAESYPSRPVRVVVGYVAGGGVDITMRILCDPTLISGIPGCTGTNGDLVGFFEAECGFPVRIEADRGAAGHFWKWRR